MSNLMNTICLIACDLKKKILKCNTLIWHGAMLYSISNMSIYSCQNKLSLDFLLFIFYFENVIVIIIIIYAVKLFLILFIFISVKPVVHQIKSLRLNRDDFEVLKVIGRGAFGDVS